MFDRSYIRQVELLLRVIPLLQKKACFALKGGTAMNLFVQDMPRLSVDIDLAYLPLVPRENALEGISAALEQLAVETEETMQGVQVFRQPVAGVTGRLVVNAESAQIKVEPNFVFRGALFPVEIRSLCASAQMEFERFVEACIVSEADLYGGKICAALDRQHPRDLFDIHLLFGASGLTDNIRSAFTIYLAGHPRPMAELLDPNELPLGNLYTSQFSGMMREPVSVETLVETRRRLVKELNDRLTENERLFLLSIKMGAPEWSRIPIEHLDQLPALQWKLRNIRSMDPVRHGQAVDKLKRVLKL